MMALAMVLLRLLILSLLLPLHSYADSIGHYCAKSFSGARTQASIDAVLSDLVAKASVGGFATSSSGKGTGTVYGLAQCRGDVSSEDCSACLADAAKKLPAACPSQADARVWYDYCFMRYDDERFIGQADTGYAVIYYNVENATEPEAFDKATSELMGKVRAQAVQAGSEGLGRGKKDFAPFVTIYGLAQCTRDLQPLSCAQCLSSAVEKFPDYCRYRVGCQVLYSSCMVRYEIYPFFFPLDTVSKTRGGAGADGGSKNSRTFMAIWHPSAVLHS